jgi:hypothetical protein
VAKQEEKATAKEKRKSTKAEETGYEAPVASAALADELVSTEEPATDHTVVEPETTEPATATEPTIAERRETTAPVPIRTSMEDQASVRMRESAAEANKDDGLVTPMSPTTPKDGGKVKSWLKTKFSRRMSKGSRPVKEDKTSMDKETSSFVGGAALTGASANNNTASLAAESSSVTDVANAATSAPVATIDGGEEYRGRTTTRMSDVSALSDDDNGREDEDFQEARDNFDADLAPPPTFPAEKSSSPVRSTKFTEAI